MWGKPFIKYLSLHSALSVLQRFGDITKAVNMEPIVHICAKKEWIEARKIGIYKAANQALDGFIHCSKVTQILRVANKYFSTTNDLVLLWIDPDHLDSELRWEESDDDIFPHLYGLLNLDAVIGVSDFQPGPDGIFREVRPPPP